MAALDVAVDVSGAQGRIPSAARLSSVTASAINKVARAVRADALERIFEQSLLPRSYVRERIVLVRASPGNPEAIIKSPKRGVLLTRYPYRQLYKRGKSGKRIAAGISIRIKPGRAPIRAPWFVRRLRAGQQSGAGALGIARADPSRPGKIEVLHGPSVSQIFSSVRRDIEPEARASAGAAVEAAIQSLISKARQDRGKA